MFVLKISGAARFDTPSSLIFDPICDCMYVTDQFRGSIRKLTRDATVSTIYGGDNVKPNKVKLFVYDLCCDVQKHN